VSQTPIREALARLERDGLVTKQENGRYRTEPLLTRTSFDHLYDVRLQLEPFAASEAARCISSEDLERLKAADQAMRRAPTGNIASQFAEFTAGNAAFHDIIARAAGNRFLFEAIDRLHSHYRLAQLYLHHGIVDAAPALREHAEIVQVIVARNAELAAERMRGHIERSRHQLEGLLAKP
jgi:DNA-binding GntR family transcriptional regulator